MPKTMVQAEQRFRDIEILLLWEGRVGNARLRSVYGIAIGAASLLLKSFRAAYPDHCTWNTVLRAYEAPDAGFAPVLSAGVVEEYAELLSRIPESPPAQILDVRLDMTLVAPAVFATLNMASADGTGVELTYASMTSPEEASRLFFPHTIVRVERRWHVRGFDVKSNEFRDFTLGRIVDVQALQAQAPASMLDDVAWQTEVELQLVPHPGLDAGRARVVQREHMRGGTSRRVVVRAALLQYVLQDLRVAIDVERERPPDYQLALGKANAKALERWLFNRG